MKSTLVQKKVSFLAILAILATSSNAFALYAPTLTTSISGVDVSLSWTSVAGASGYTLYYAPYPYEGEHTIGNVDMEMSTSLSVTLWDGASYYVAITASDGNSSSGYSNVELVTIVRSSSYDISQLIGNWTFSDDTSYSLTTLFGGTAQGNSNNGGERVTVLQASGYIDSSHDFILSFPNDYKTVYEFSFTDSGAVSGYRVSLPSFNYSSFTGTK